MDDATRQRFFAKVMKARKTSGYCWLWTGAVRGRYGNFWFAGKDTVAHRASYMLFVGPILPGMLVTHKCDNPLCVNPSHLALGTMSDNILDAVRKGRHNSQTRPERHPNLLKKTCPRGHAYKTSIWVGKPRRWCPTCDNARRRNKTARLRAVLGSESGG